MIRKPFRLTLYVFFLIAILAGCAKTMEIVTLSPPPTDTQVSATKNPLKPTATQVPANKSQPPPTNTPAIPLQIVEPSPTSFSISETPMTERVSIASDGTQGNSGSHAPAISADGRYVAFSSSASNLVGSDTNGITDIFVHDRMTGQTQLISIASDGTQGNNDSGGSSISADGRYVAFFSSADNLVEDDTNGVQDCFVHDRVTGETTRVSISSDGTQGNGACAYFGWWFVYKISISADGRYVAFHSDATNLVEGDNNGVQDCFVHDRVTGETTKVSVASDGTQGNGSSGFPAISADGHYVVFQSDATNLVEGVTNGGIFVHDRVTGKTTLESVSSDGIQGNNGAMFPAISADGRYVAFISLSDNLVEGDTNGAWDCFVHDRITGETTRVSVASDGTQGNSDDYATPAMSADGRYVVFHSDDAGNLVEGGISGEVNIFVHDRVTGKTVLASVSSDGTQGNNGSLFPDISADGRYVAFGSFSDNLVEGDTNEDLDVYVRELGTNKQLIASITELYGVWTGLWPTDHNILMEFIATMRPRVGFEEVIVYPGDDIGREWFNVEVGILTFGDWVKGAWVKPFSASTDCINNPQATYEVYITNGDDQPKKLHFELVGEDHCLDRQNFLDGQTLTWVGTYPP